MRPAVTGGRFNIGLAGARGCGRPNVPEGWRPACGRVVRRLALSTLGCHAVCAPTLVAPFIAAGVWVVVWRDPSGRLASFPIGGVRVPRSGQGNCRRRWGRRARFPSTTWWHCLRREWHHARRLCARVHHTGTLCILAVLAPRANARAEAITTGGGAVPGSALVVQAAVAWGFNLAGHRWVARPPHGDGPARRPRVGAAVRPAGQVVYSAAAGWGAGGATALLAAVGAAGAYCLAAACRLCARTSVSAFGSPLHAVRAVSCVVGLRAR